MARKRFGIEFDGFTELIAKFDRLEGDLKEITTECLEVAPQMINPKLRTAMEKHKRSETTVKSIADDPKVEWEGNVGRIPVGFEFEKSGLSSVFLMYGTARHAPKNQYGGKKKSGAKDNPGMDADKKLYNAIYGRAIKAKIGEKQKEILLAAIRKRMGD